MKIGERAEVSRIFSAVDLRDYVKLSGHSVKGEGVPEPLIGTLFSYLLGMKLPGMGTMYLKQETCFLKDALIGEPLTAQVEITRLRPEKHLADLSTTCQRADGEIIATGHALVYIRDVVSSSGQQAHEGIDQFLRRQ